MHIPEAASIAMMASISQLCRAIAVLALPIFQHPHLDVLALRASPFLFTAFAVLCPLTTCWFPGKQNISREKRNDVATGIAEGHRHCRAAVHYVYAPMSMLLAQGVAAVLSAEELPSESEGIMHSNNSRVACAFGMLSHGWLSPTKRDTPLSLFRSHYRRGLFTEGNSRIFNISKSAF